MQSLRIKGATHTLAKDQPQFNSLHIRRVTYDDGQVGLKSAWEPSPDELKRLNAGGSVVLEILSSAHPPVSLSVSHFGGETDGKTDIYEQMREVIIKQHRDLKELRDILRANQMPTTDAQVEPASNPVMNNVMVTESDYQMLHQLKAKIESIDYAD